MAGLRTTDEEPAAEDRPQGGLGPSTWLLIPLIAIGGYAFLSPALALARGESADTTLSPREERAPAVVLVPYQDELLPLISEESIAVELRSIYRALHEKHRTRTEEKGGIPERAMRNVRRALEKHGR